MDAEQISRKTADEDKQTHSQIRPLVRFWSLCHYTENQVETMDSEAGWKRWIVKLGGSDG